MTVKQLFGVIGAAIPICAAVWAILEYTDTRYTFFYEHRALAAQVEKNTDSILRAQLRDLRSEKAKLELLKLDFERESASPPEWLIERLTDIDSEEEEIQGEMKNE